MFSHQQQTSRFAATKFLTTWNGVDYSTAGTYTANLLTVAGCDSVATLNLTINPTLTSTTNITICSNQVPYSWNGTNYSTAGTYTANLLTVAGCDSVATLNLIINDVLTSTTDITICSNQVPYNWNGVDYSTAGTYTANLLTVAGCDSVATLNLSINPTLTSTTNVTICSNQVPYSWNGTNYSAAGTYTANLLTVAGCDSVGTLNLTINPTLTSTTNVVICSNEVPYSWNGTNYITAGTYTANLLTVAGCDSVATLNLTINPTLTSTTNVTICSNQVPYSWNGTNYSTAGTYTANLLTVAGCDSVATLNLTINPTLTSTTNITICSNQVPYSWNGTNYGVAGTYTANLLTVAGCDSVATLNLSINPTLTSTTNVTICSNQVPYSWNGTNYSTAGTYTANLMTVAGCDSVATLNLTINPTLTSTTNITICSNQVPYSWNGTNYSIAGTYTANLLTVAGCDSVATLNLSINPTHAISQSVSICQGNSYTLPSGISVTTAGNYTSSFLNVFGCDSIITTSVSFYPSPQLSLTNTTGTNTLTCDVTAINVTLSGNGVANWLGGVSAPFTTPGTYTAQLTTSNGCSVQQSIVINEDITLPNGAITVPGVATTLTCSTTSITLTATGGTVYQWQNPVSSNASINVNEPGNYVVEIFGPNGCSVSESIQIAIDTIAPIASISNLSGTDLLTCDQTTIILQGGGNGTYVWQPGGATSSTFNATTPGLYTLSVTAANGCTDQSTYTILQNIDEPGLTELYFEICGDDTHILPDGSVVNVSGLYPVILNAWNGCDSLVNTTLVVHPIYSEVVNVRICPTETYTLPNGQVVSTSGSYPTMLQTVFGCDSLITTNLEVLPQYNQVFNVTICPGESYVLPDGAEVVAQGAYALELQSVAGCDSIVTFNLEIYVPVIVQQQVSICSGESYQLPTGNFVNTTGAYPVVLESVFGCDSTIVYNLQVIPNQQQFVNETICQGTEYILPDGSTANQSGVYAVTVESPQGCESTVITTLTIQPQISVDFTPYSDTVRICYGDTVTLTAMGAQLYNFDPNDYLIEVGTNYASAAPPISMMYFLDGETGSCTDGDSIFVEVIPLPVITATTVEDIICQGDSVLIQAYGADSYEWYPALGSSCADCEETLVAPMETTTYQVTGILNGCDAQGFVTVDVASAPIAFIAPDTTICLEQSITLTASGGGSYLWDNGEDTDSITVSPTEPSEYSVIVSIGSCIDTASIFIGVNPIPDVFAGYDTLITLGGTATLQATGALDYEWTPIEDLSCATCDLTDASPIVTTTYCVEGINEFGCKSTDCVDVQVNVLCDNFFIPNAFAPSKGGHEANDCFQVFGTDCFETYTITIYNRWGEIVFESSNPKDCWDGTHRDKELNTAVFVYHFEGVLLTGDAFKKQGNISLIK
jgi:gliding motility-associated-like protein